MATLFLAMPFAVTLLFSSLTLPELRGSFEGKNSGLEQNGAVTTSRTDSVLAWVLGKSIALKDSQNLSGFIIGNLLERYAEEKHIGVSENEIERFILRNREITAKLDGELVDREKMLAQELSSGTLNAYQRKTKEEELKTARQFLATKKRIANPPSPGDSVTQRIRMAIARHAIRSWKINLSLYRKYRGRAIFQQAGIEPLDAYRAFLKEHERKGNFRILHRALSDRFWKYFTNDSLHTFVPENEKERLLDTPWWEMEK